MKKIAFMIFPCFFALYLNGADTKILQDSTLKDVVETYKLLTNVEKISFAHLLYYKIKQHDMHLMKNIKEELNAKKTVSSALQLILNPIIQRTLNEPESSENVNLSNQNTDIQVERDGKVLAILAPLARSNDYDFIKLIYSRLVTGIFEIISFGPDKGKYFPVFNI